MVKPRILLHGGAGSWKDSSVKEKAMEVMHRCTRHAYKVLLNSGASDAVVEAVRCMEDSGYLNAGWGSVLDLLGGRSLDAGYMDSTGNVGAVAAVIATRNPVVLARIVALETPHILLGGEGADRLAILKHLPPLPPPPKHVYERYRQALEKLFKGEVKVYGKAILEFLSKNKDYEALVRSIARIGDTVGAVAIDANGLLAAAVSTGGIILKLPGRIGDSPIPGAGFYASAETACSATGWGEQIIKSMPCMMLDRFYNETGDFEKALDKTIEYVESTVGKDTMGFIAVSKNGELGWRYNTEAMLIGYVDEEGKIVVNDKRSRPP